MKAFRRIDKIYETTINIAKTFGKKIVVADIATDHGFIAEKIASSEIIEKVIATDISEKSLSKLEKLIKLKKLEKIETLVGDGLEPIQSVDICVIAGIGGFEIRKMIENQNKTDSGVKSKIFILQPAQNPVELREWIFDNKFKVLCDITIEDSERFYAITAIDVSEFEETEKSLFNLWIGRDSRENKQDFCNYLEYLREYLRFSENVLPSRIENDKMLLQKCELYKKIDSYLTDN